MIFLKTLIFAVFSLVSSEYYDPHDLKITRGAAGNQVEVFSSQNAKPISQENGVKIQFQRHVNRLLNAFELKENTNKTFHGVVHLKIHKEDLDFLVEFGKKERLSEEDFRRLEGVLSESLETSFFPEYKIVLWFDYVKELVCCEEFQKFAVIALIVVFGVKCYVARTSITDLVKYGGLTLFLVSFFFKLKEEESKEQAKQHNLPIRVFVDHSKALLTDLSSLFASIVGGFGLGLFKELSWSALFLYPLLLIFSVLLLALGLNKPIYFNIFHLLGFSVGSQKHTQEERPLIQEVPQKKHKKASKVYKIAHTKRVHRPKAIKETNTRRTTSNSKIATEKAQKSGEST